ncbi:hypothetical protein AB9F45_36190, partial [Rhizobium leguminosarum]|uniref:hypothetical protein n=1 Tax=Rhizobium leguminosarum TaxID=384 RepID=UPI003F9D0BF0
SFPEAVFLCPAAYAAITDALAATVPEEDEKPGHFCGRCHKNALMPYHCVALDAHLWLETTARRWLQWSERRQWGSLEWVMQDLKV